jgi:signal transduction histidine kinase
MPAVRRRRRDIDGRLDELRLEIEALRASRARLVAAADAERRRVERELHDGAQQHLVALAVNVQLARQLVESDPPAAQALLEEIGRDVRDALESVRRLAGEIYPPLLPDRGLAEALRAAAAAAGIPARVETASLGRYAAELEATVYFFCREALANAARHAGPDAQATVRAWAEDGALRFEVEDDGVGFDPRTRGAGLTALGDRLEAVAGRLTISAAPGRGTRVSGTIPLPG